MNTTPKIKVGTSWVQTHLNYTDHPFHERKACSGLYHLRTMPVKPEKDSSLVRYAYEIAMQEHGHQKRTIRCSYRLDYKEGSPTYGQVLGDLYETPQQAQEAADRWLLRHLAAKYCWRRGQYGATFYSDLPYPLVGKKGTIEYATRYAGPYWLEAERHNRPDGSVEYYARVRRWVGIFYRIEVGGPRDWQKYHVNEAHCIEDAMAVCDSYVRQQAEEHSINLVTGDTNKKSSRRSK